MIFRHFSNLVAAIVRSLLEMLELVSQWPRRLSLRLFGSHARRPWWKTILLLPLLLPYWLWMALGYPLSFPRISLRRRRDLLFGLPALVALLLFSTALAVRFVRADRVQAGYLMRMQSALQAGDFKLASVLGARLISQAAEVEPWLLYQYAMALDKLGETQRARSIINDLAPDNRVGLPAAHLVRGIAIYSELQAAPDKTKLKRLRWHLENCGQEPSEQAEQLWAFYHGAVGETAEAARHLELAAKFNPGHWLNAAEIYRQTGNMSGVDRSLRSAEQALFEKLEADPTNRDIRLQLALTLSKLKRIEQAEQILQVGLQLHSDAAMLRSVADFYLMRFDLDSRSSTEFGQRFAYLQKALDLDINYMQIYTRLIKMYAEKQSAVESLRIRNLLEGLVAEGKSTALAHFALSSLLLVDGKSDDALWHLQQSFRLDKTFPVVSNNLAWLLAAAEPPRLAEAFQLAQQAVQSDPKNSQFLDTLGTVLMKQGKLDEASAELEKALSGSAPSQKYDIHLKLAAVYKQLGQESLSEKHKALAKASQP